MTRLYLSVTDPAAVAQRAAIADAMALLAGPDHGESWTAAQSDAYAALARAHATLSDRVSARCIACGRDHDALYVVTRAVRPWGHFGTAVINRRRIVIDASLPTLASDGLPRDAVAVSADDAARLWHDDNESHVFGGPNVAAMLRTAVRS